MMRRIIPGHPSRVYPLFLLLFFYGLSSVSVLQAQGGSLLAKDDGIRVRLGASAMDVAASKFLSNDDHGVGTTWAVEQSPRHGRLFEPAPGNDGFIYRPDREFWSLGLDSLVYSIESPDGETSTATIYFYIRDRLELIYEENFEDTAYQNFLYNNGTVNFRHAPNVPIAETGSLEIAVGQDGEGYLEIDIGEGGTGGSSESNADSGQACGIIDDSEDRSNILNKKIVLIKLGNDGFGPVGTIAQLVYEWDGATRLVSAEVWDELSDSFISTPPVALVSDHPEVQITWYQNLDRIGVWVEADGRVEGPVEGYNPTPFLQRVRFGVMPKGTVPHSSFEFDDVQVWRKAAGGQLRTLPVHVSEDFEGGQFDHSPTIVGSGIFVTPDAAITGKNGLKVDLQQGDSYVRSVWNTADKEIAMRFHVDTSQLTMNSDEMFTFLASGADPTDFSDLSLRLYLKRSNGQTSMASHIYQDVGSPVTLSWTEVPDSFEVLVRLRDSSSDAIGNGFLQLWINEELHEVFHVPNGSRLLHWSQLGAHGVDEFTSGFLRIDDLTIWQ